jgi:hypothetical protein
MTANTTPNHPRSRRALLAGALGGLGAWAAATVARVDPTAAAAGDPIRMGRLNLASSTATTLQTKTSRAAYLVNQLGAGAAVKGVATSGRAIMGQAGAGGTAVWAYATNHYAVHAQAETGIAVDAHSEYVGVYASGSMAGLVATGGDFAAQFEGRISHAGVYDLFEVASQPDVPPSSAVRLFARRESGTGKAQLCVKFTDGSVQVLATQA